MSFIFTYTSLSLFLFCLFINNFKHDVQAPFKFVIFEVIIVFLIYLLSLVVLLCQLYKSTAIVAMLVKFFLKNYYNCQFQRKEKLI